MNGTKRGSWIPFAVILVMLACGVGAAVAAGPGGPHGRFGHDPMFKLLVRLDLTDAQKTSVANIIKQNEANIKSIATGLVKARVQLAKDVLNGSDSTVIAADCQGVAQYALQAAQMRAQVMAQIIPILSADQKTTLQNIQDKLGSNIDAAIETRFERLDKWIARHQ